MATGVRAHSLHTEVRAPCQLPRSHVSYFHSKSYDQSRIGAWLAPGVFSERKFFSSHSSTGYRTVVFLNGKNFGKRDRTLPVDDFASADVALANLLVS